MNTRRRARYAGWALVGGLLLTGCGDQPGLDASAVESYLVQSQTSVLEGLEIGDASCPDDAELREAMTLKCTLAVEDATVPYRVRLRDVREEKVRVDVSLDAVVLLAEEVQRFLRSTLPKEFRSADVTCGSAVIVTDVGETLDCTLASGPQTKPVTIRVEDAAGNISIV